MTQQDPKKKLLLLTPDFPPRRGGVARYLSLLANKFSDQITVIADLDSDWQSFDPSATYPIFRMPLLYKFFWPRWWKTVRYLKSVKTQYDTFLISHVLPFGTAAMVANVPYILFVHGMDIRLAGKSARKRRIAKRVMQKARIVVTNSQALADEISRDYGIGSLVVYPCVESVADQEFQPKATGTTNLVSVSRLVERKGHTLVLNALAALRQSGRLKNVHYDIVGTGPMYQTLKSMTHELGLDSIVKFHGDVSDAQLTGLYSSSDIFVLPVSNDPVDKEGFGLVFIEAATHAVPSITSDISGVNEAVINGETGILISPNDQDQLVNAIQLLLSKEEYRKQLGESARDRVMHKFTCDDQFKKLEPYL